MNYKNVWLTENFNVKNVILMLKDLTNILTMVYLLELFVLIKLLINFVTIMVYIIETLIHNLSYLNYLFCTWDIIHMN